MSLRRQAFKNPWAILAATAGVDATPTSALR